MAHIKRRNWPPEFLDRVVQAVEADTSDDWQTARCPEMRLVNLTRWGLSARSIGDALQYLASTGRIDYYLRGRYGPAGTRDLFLAEHNALAEESRPNVRIFTAREDSHHMGA